LQLVSGDSLYINEKTKTGAKTYFFKSPIVKVNTVAGFLAAIGSNKVIILAPGKYVLPKDNRQTENAVQGVLWEERFDGQALTIQYVENLRIICEGEKPAEIIADSLYADVLTFSYCDNITVENVLMGHKPYGAEECTGDVLVLVNSNWIELKKVGLYGCGQTGLWVEDSSNITVTDSSIYDCSLMLGRFLNSKNLNFDRCVFRDSADGFVLLNVDGFVMDHSEVKNNGEDLEPMGNAVFAIGFDAEYKGSEKKGGIVRNTKFTNNNMGFLTFGSDLQEEGNTYDGNYFTDKDKY
jgi:hypothetical protein